MNVFTLKRPVEFNHCDAAGIVFYPRYFEMISATVERFFADALNYSFHDALKDQGTSAPLVAVQTSFMSPSRLGDDLTFSLCVNKIGGASAELEITCLCDDQIRFVAELSIVHCHMDPPKAQPWPSQVADKLNAYLK